MMSADDSQIESILKHYRPAGASPELKERIFGPKRRKTNWTRLAATATILVAAGLALTYHILSQPEKQTTRSTLLKSNAASCRRLGRNNCWLLPIALRNRPWGENTPKKYTAK